MSSVRNNAFANIFGNAWSALMGVVFIPLYIHLMGVEAYGIVGVFTSIQTMLLVLDLGLSQTLAREMARLSSEPGGESRMADTAYTLEVIYWVVACAVILVFGALSRYIAYRWLNPEVLTRDSLADALLIIAFVIGIRWPIALYVGGLNGLQRQVEANVIKSLFGTVQALGAIATLTLIRPTVEVFFLWQAAVAVLHVATLKIVMWRFLPGRGAGKRFSRAILKDIWRFAAVISGISLIGTILTQLDKVILSRMLPLAEFGYYTFAVTIAASVYIIVGPVYVAFYPKLTEFVSRGSHDDLVHSYHQGSQLLSVLVLPASLTLALFSREILGLWVRDPVIVANSHLLVSLLVAGNAMHGLMHMPHALQFAHGETRICLLTNTVAVILLAPAIYLATHRWGTVGAASVWVLLNVGYLLIEVPITHHFLLKSELSRWYRKDVLRILAGTLLVLGTGRVLISGESGPLLKILSIGMALATASVVAVLSADSLKPLLPFKRFGDSTSP